MTIGAKMEYLKSIFLRYKKAARKQKNNYFERILHELRLSPQTCYPSDNNFQTLY